MEIALAMGYYSVNHLLTWIEGLVAGVLTASTAAKYVASVGQFVANVCLLKEAEGRYYNKLVRNQKLYG